MSNAGLMADVSNNNGHVDIDAYAHAGHRALALKASEGTSFVDPFHRGNALRAGGHHLSLVHYHFARPDVNDNPVAEARHFWDAVRHLAGPRDYLALDLERATPAGWKHDPAWSREFDAEIRKLSRFNIILYTMRSAFDEAAGGGSWFADPPERVWDADWSGGPDRSPSGSRTLIRQFTDGVFGPEPHSATGIGRCDMNVLRPAFLTEILRHR